MMRRKRTNVKKLQIRVDWDVFVYVRLCLCICVCVCVCAFAFVHACAREDIRAYLRTGIHACTHTHDTQQHT